MSPNRSEMDKDEEPSPVHQPAYEESMRVSIADPAAERERKKMLDALKRREAQAARSSANAGAVRR